MSRGLGSLQSRLRMKKYIPPILLLVFGVQSLQAQYKFRFGYTATLSAKDRVSSKGAKLKTVAAILQQDRANFHKFKKRDKRDTDDGGFFAKVSNRAAMTRFINHGSADKALKKKILQKECTVLVEFFTEDGEELLNVSIVE